MRCTHHPVHHQSLAVSYSHICTLLLYLAERFTHHTTLLFPGSCNLTYTHTLDTLLPLYWISWQDTHSTPLLDLMARHSENPPFFWILLRDIHTTLLYLAVRCTHHSTPSLYLASNTHTPLYFFYTVSCSEVFFIVSCSEMYTPLYSFTVSYSEMYTPYYFFLNILDLTVRCALRASLLAPSSKLCQI